MDDNPARYHRLETLVEDLAHRLHAPLVGAKCRAEEYLNVLEALAIVTAALVVGAGSSDNCSDSLDFFIRRLLAHIDALSDPANRARLRPH